MALADYLALYVDKVYAAPGEYQAPALLLATFAFAWQIYFDFCGYTDMARGIARMMGIRLMLNFNNPYLADGLGDFWNRWHISLSTWFKDYVYIPLGGNRHGKLRTYLNMFLTMVISGLWHGATWTFLIWGALHAAGACLTRGLEGTAVLPATACRGSPSSSSSSPSSCHVDLLPGRDRGRRVADPRGGSSPAAWPTRVPLLALGAGRWRSGRTSSCTSRGCGGCWSCRRCGWGSSWRRSCTWRRSRRRGRRHSSTSSFSMSGVHWVACLRRLFRRHASAE